MLTARVTVDDDALSAETGVPPGRVARFVQALAESDPSGYGCITVTWNTHT